MYTFFTKKLYRHKIVIALCCLIVSTSNVLLPAELVIISPSQNIINNHATPAYYEDAPLAPLIGNIVLPQQTLSRGNYALAIVFITVCAAVVPLGIHELVQESKEELLELAGVKRHKVIEEFGKAISYQE